MADGDEFSLLNFLVYAVVLAVIALALEVKKPWRSLGIGLNQPVISLNGPQITAVAGGPWTWRNEGVLGPLRITSELAVLSYSLEEKGKTVEQGPCLEEPDAITVDGDISTGCSLDKFRKFVSVSPEDLGIHWSEVDHVTLYAAGVPRIEMKLGGREPVFFGKFADQKLILTTRDPRVMQVQRSHGIRYVALDKAGHALGKGACSDGTGQLSIAPEDWTWESVDAVRLDVQ